MNEDEKKLRDGLADYEKRAGEVLAQRRKQTLNDLLQKMVREIERLKMRQDSLEKQFNLFTQLVTRNDRNSTISSD
ncbi:MAG: hypothetical protein GWN62_13835 [Aliifodinibius sp.]|nr:hypothetical protein [Fodinibius sp.]